MLHPSMLQMLKELLEDGMRKDPQNMGQVLVSLLKDLALLKPQHSEDDLTIFAEYRHPLYQVVKQLDTIKAFIASKGLDGATTSEINDFFSSEFKAGLIKERLEMLIFNKNIKMGKKRIGVYVSNVYYVI